MTEPHVHEWWYQPPIKNHRLFASRQERGDYFYCNVGDHNGSRTPGLDSGCRAISYENPLGQPKPVKEEAE